MPQRVRLTTTTLVTWDVRHGGDLMKRTYWFDLEFLEPPLDDIPGLVMYVGIKHSNKRSTPTGEQVCVGHEALRAAELEGYVAQLRDELDSIVSEAKRRDADYHRRLRGKEND